MPDKTYKTILIDPPWNQKGGGKVKRGADRHYKLMKEPQIRYFRGQHELCLFATKGRGFGVRTELNNVSSLLGKSLITPTKHSKKPNEMYELIESRSQGPYLELFARNTRDGWDSWGDELDNE